MKGALIAIMFLSTTVKALPQIEPLRKQTSLSAKIEGLDWPKDFEKDLKSGLKTRLVFQVALQNELVEIVSAESGQLEISYDLWDEIYLVNQTDGIQIEIDTKYQKKEDLINALGQIKILKLYNFKQQADMRKSYAIATQVFLNPIEAERVEMIRKWVSQNSLSPSLVDSSSSMSQRPLVRFSEVFNALFDQYTAGKSKIAVWSRRLLSEKFIPEDLKNEKP